MLTTESVRNALDLNFEINDVNMSKHVSCDHSKKIRSMGEGSPMEVLVSIPAMLASLNNVTTGFLSSAGMRNVGCI